MPVVQDRNEGRSGALYEVATVFRCPSCKRHFRAGYWDGKEDFYRHVQDAISFSFSFGEGERIIELLAAGEIEGLKQLVAQQAGHLEEVRKRRHSHRDPKAGCWCEYGQDAWKVVNTYDQVTLEVIDLDFGYR